MRLSTADRWVALDPARLTLAVLVTLLCNGCGAKDRTSDIKQVQDDVRKMNAALYENNLDALLSFTHPSAIEAMGGKLRARESLKQAISVMQEKGMKVESFNFPTAPTFLKTSQREYVVVPTLSIIAASGQRVESLNYQFGMRTIGISEWAYLEGSRVNKENVRKIFPDFPADFDFPPIYRKKLD